MSNRSRLHVSISHSTRNRLERYSKQHGDITMGDITDAALKNFFDQKDRENSAPDLVLERLSQLLLSNMQIAQAIGAVNDKMSILEEDVSDLREGLVNNDGHTRD